MKKTYSLLILLLFIFSSVTFAQIGVTVNPSGTQLAQIMSGPGVIITNVTLNCPTGAAGSFTCNNCSLGMDSGIVLTNGKVVDILGPNNNTGSSDSYAWGTAGDQDLANSIHKPLNQLFDACVLEFDLTVQSDSVQFKYIFGSEEYPEFVCSPFNDVFAFFISGPGIAGLKNIALIPGTTIPVSINSVNAGAAGAFNQGGTCDSVDQSLAYSQYYVNNGDGTTAPYNSSAYYIQYDGFTKTLTAAIGGLISCQTYHLKLAIADVGDPTYDSGVFIQANSLSSNLVVFDSAQTSATGIDSAIRGCVDGIFNLHFQKPVSQNTTVYYITGGTAVNGVDYSSLTDSIQFLTGDSIKQVIIHPIGSASQTQSVTLYLTTSCSATPYDSSTLFILPSPNVVTGPDTTICRGDTVRLYATGAITYSWTPATNLSATNIRNPLAYPAVSTTYICVGTVYGCTATDSVVVTVYSTPPFSVNAGPDVLTCGSNTVQLNATVTGNPITGHPFTYNWTPTTGLSNTAIANPLDTSVASTTYIVNVTSGHCSTSDTIVITIDSLRETLSSTATTCSYASTGTATATVTAGSAPYTYNWNSGGLAATDNNLAAGLYQVTTTDRVGCTISDTITVYAPPAIIFNAPTTTSVSCVGGTNGTATITATGGTGNITYTWSSGSVTSTANNLAAGTYTVTATDANLCTATTTVSVGTLPPVTATITTTNVSCFGGADGTVTVAAGGGTSPYTYLWSTGASSISITGLIIGAYPVTVTDNAGCTLSATGNVAQPQLLSASEISTDISCFGGSNGTIAISTSGGTPPYTYSWNDGNHQQNRTNLITGTYLLTITDAHNCTTFDTAALTQPTALALSAAVTNTTCYGGSNGAINLTVTGGTPPYAYNWGIGITSQNATNLPADTYYPSVTDNQGCLIDTTIQVTSPPEILFGGADITNATCFGKSDGIAMIHASGGVGTYTYSWNGTIAANPDSSLAAGTYAVIVTDANNCTAVDPVTITQPALLTLTITGQNALCFNGPDGLAVDVVTGGTQPYSYLWSNNQTTKTAIAIVAGIYQSTVTDYQGCTASNTVFISQPTQILYSIDSTPVKCIGSKDGTISVNVISGGVPPYSYAATQNLSTYTYTTDSTILGLATGYYTVLIADNNGCILLDSTFVPDAIPDSFNITTDSTSCFGPQYTDGAIHVAGLVIQNTPYQYRVDGSPFQFSGDFYNLAPGSHTIGITNFNGCPTDTTALIGAPIQGVADILPADSTIQLGETIQLFSSFANYPTSAIVSYNWVPSTGLSCVDCPNPVVSSYSHINNYTLTITYNKGCLASASSRVIVIGMPPVYIPNSFTPNGDGNNDLFLIYGEGIKTVNLKIFNRWGEMVFNSENQFLGWDGNYKGANQPVGVYVYEAQITFLDNRQTLRTGSITLIR